MGNINHYSILDSFDKTSIFLYRGSLFIISILFLFSGIVLFVGKTSLPSFFFFSIIILVNIALSNIHLYLKKPRFIFSLLPILIFFFYFLGVFFNNDWSNFFIHLSTGIAFIAISMIGIKEYFCFKMNETLPLPLLLALSIFSHFFQQYMLAAIFFSLSSIFLLFLSSRKLMMPLYYDIGDKSRYEI